MSTSLGWGIVGCGWVARDYVAPALRRARSARLVALCDPDARALGRVAAESPDALPFADLDAFLRAPGLDAIYIATPNHLHAPVTEAAANAGKHVLCEKPMATNLVDAERMVRACAEAGVVYATAFDQRFHARHRRLKRLAEAGRLGTITAARIHYACWTPPEWRPESDDGEHDNWRADPARAGGGAFMDLAPHGLDLLQHLLGEPLVEIATLLQRRIHTYAVDDGAALIGRFAGGALALLNVAYNCPDAFPRRTLELIGTKAMAVAHNTMGQTPGGTLHLIDAATGASVEERISSKEDISPFEAQVEAFSHCLLAGEPFPFPPAGDLHTMRLLEEGNTWR
jgi:predicted dehydrogenase